MVTVPRHKDFHLFLLYDHMRGKYHSNVNRAVEVHMASPTLDTRDRWQLAACLLRAGRSYCGEGGAGTQEGGMTAGLGEPVGHNSGRMCWLGEWPAVTACAGEKISSL